MVCWWRNAVLSCAASAAFVPASADGPRVPGLVLSDLEDVREVLRASQTCARAATNAVWLDAGVFPWPSQGALAALAAEAYPFPDPGRIHLFASEDAATREVVVADAAGAPLAALPGGEEAGGAPSRVGVRLTLAASGDSAAGGAPAAPAPSPAAAAVASEPLSSARGGAAAATNAPSAAFVPTAARVAAPSAADAVRAVRARTRGVAAPGADGVLYYDFGAAPADGVVLDRSGNGHDGAASGCVWTPAGRFHGGAMAFSSNADSVNVGRDLDVPSWERYSVSLWFLHDGGGDLGPQYGHKMLDKTSWYHDWHLHLNPPGQEGGATGGIGLFLYEGGVSAGLGDGSRNWADGEWHHLVVVRDGAHGALWVDGTLRDENDGMISVAGDSPLCVGNSYSGDYYQRKGWHGRLDEIRIYDRALSADEIRALHAEGVPRLDDGGDADGDGLSNLDERLLGTDPLVADTDGDGLSDGEEVGCVRQLDFGGEWACASNGWAAVEAESDEEGGYAYFWPDEPLVLGGERVEDVVFQWNGVLFLNTSEHYRLELLEDVPEELSCTNASLGTALVVAPFWAERPAGSAAPAVSAFRRASGGQVEYAVRYDGMPGWGTGAPSFQVTFAFTNGVHRWTDVVYGADLPSEEAWEGACVGALHLLSGVAYARGDFPSFPPSPLRRLRFLPGTGTDPLAADTDADGLDDGWEVDWGLDPASPSDGADADADGDGLANGRERALGTSPVLADTDGDGLPDGWEVGCGLDPLSAVGPDGASGDPDGDGLSNAQERIVGTSPTAFDTDGDGAEVVAGTNPLAPDTDGDGVSDAWEFVRGSNPLLADTDGDGLDDGREAALGTDPARADTDGDGLGDAAEVAAGTDPLNPDTDGDGLSDGREAALGTDPLNPDTDGDGVDDGEEVDAGFDPLRADTDGDGLLDGEERALGSSPVLADADGDGLPDGEERRLGTFPDRADTDGDGLSDGREVELGTDPLRADTDGDGLEDGREVELGADPLDPDTDGDGLSDGDEVAAGASPLLADTDGDGMPDAWEVRHGLNPNRDDAALDADRDGLSNIREFQLGTSPDMKDTDEDGLDDWQEAVTLGTSPVLVDTDGDGLDDGYEAANALNPGSPDTDFDGLPDGWELAHGLNPRVGAGWEQGEGGGSDKDQDGLSNAQEYALGTYPEKRDTDGDGVDDGEEVGCWRTAYHEDFWVSAGTNGWTAVETEAVASSFGTAFLLEEPLRCRRAWSPYVLCLWNGALLLGDDDMFLSNPAPAMPADLASGPVSGAHVVVAPLWRARTPDTRPPAISAFRRGPAKSPQYAVRYDGYPADGTNTLSFQVVFSFTGGVFRCAEIVYSPGASVLSGTNACVGARDNQSGTAHVESFFAPLSLPSLCHFQFFPGTGGDPTCVDTDGDGLADGAELAFGTDPRQPDTDGDGMDDGWEARGGLDPSFASDPDADPDGDGLTNAEECLWGTDPTKADTDGDGVPDGEEVGAVPRGGAAARGVRRAAAVGGFSDPTDPADGGQPGSRVLAVVCFGDPSGSHSEKYRLDVTCVSGGRGAVTRINQNYGVCESQPLLLVPGGVYEISLSHAGTSPECGAPDYDYKLVLETCPAGARLEDPLGLFGEHDDVDAGTFGPGRAARLYVPDADGRLPDGGQGGDGGDEGGGSSDEGPPTTWPPKEDEDPPVGPPEEPPCPTAPTLQVTFDGGQEAAVGCGGAATPARLSIHASGGGRVGTLRIVAEGLGYVRDAAGDGPVVLPKDAVPVPKERPYEATFSCRGAVPGVVRVRCTLTLDQSTSPLSRTATLYALGEPRLVFDYDRDGRIGASDAARARDGRTVFRFWVNDDADRGDVCPGRGYEDDRPGGGRRDGDDARVNGRRDLVDFAPVWIDLSDVFPPGVPDRLRRGVEWRLRSPCVNAVWTSLGREEAGAFQRAEAAGGGFGPSLAQAAREARTADLEAGAVLSPDAPFGRRLAEGEDAVFLVEGRRAGTELAVEGTLRAGGAARRVASGQARMRISPVSEMYRLLDLRSAVPGGGPAADRLGDPPNWPDAERGGPGHVVLVHGFNVSPGEAEASAAETFKRLWQSGLDAAFTAVGWRGDEGQFSTLWHGTKAVNYYVNALHAFETAPAFARRLNALPGPKTVVAHSLGNLLVSSAAKDHGLSYARYFMLNAAVAAEAYDDDAFSEAMVDPAWAAVPERFRAAGWHALFDGAASDGDLRRALSWRGRFEGLANAVNLYSASEDVVGNAVAGRPDVLQSVWVLQELSKGGMALHALNAVGLLLPGSPVVCEGGWGVSPRYALDPRWYLPGRGFTSKAAEALADADAVARPLFTRLEDEGLHAPGVFSGEGPAHGDLSARDGLRARLLADAIPAVSGAAGANALDDAAGIINVRLDDGSDDGCIANAGEWPRVDDGVFIWEHSDFKSVAYFFVYRIFDRFAGTEGRHVVP